MSLMIFFCQLTACGPVKDWLLNGKPKECPQECRILPAYDEGSCTACYKENLEGEWEIVVDIPDKKSFDGTVEICCGEIDISGDLGMGVSGCTLSGDACKFTVTCELSSFSGCSGQAVLEGRMNGDTVSGTASGCGYKGTFSGSRDGTAPCHMEIHLDAQSSDADASN